MLKYKHIQAAHELRMWILTLSAGLVASKTLLDKCPNVKEKLTKVVNGLKKGRTADETDKVIKVVVVREEES